MPKILKVGIALIVVIYVIFGPILLVKSVKETAFYLTEGSNTVQINAVVADVQETTASDIGSEYTIYLSYQYNEKMYNNVYWKSVSFEDDYSVGDPVNVEIFKSKPNDIVDPGSGNYFGWIFPLFITILGPLAAIKTFNPDFSLIKKKKSESENINA